MRKRLTNVELVANPSPDVVQGRLAYVKGQIDTIFEGNPALIQELATLVDEWIQYLLVSRGKSEHTAFTYLTHILYLFEFMKATESNLSMASSQAMKLVAWMPNTLSHTTKNIALYAARSLYKYLTISRSTTEKQIINPFRDIEGVKSPTRLPRPLSEQEYYKIYEIMARMRKDKDLLVNRRFLVDYELFGFIMLMNSGMRTMELLKLRVDDVHRDQQGNIDVLVSGKGDVERYTVVTDVYDLFRNYFSKELFGQSVDIEDFFWKGLGLGRSSGRDDYAFGNIVIEESSKTGKSKRVTRSVLSRHVLYDLLRVINSFPRQVEGKEDTNITLHQFRHSYATWMLNHPRKRLDLAQVKKLLGHKSIATTLVYAEVKDATLLSDIAQQRQR